MPIMPMPPKKNLIVIVLAVLFIVVFPTFSKLVNLITDFWWFKELHLQSIFIRSLYTKIACGLVMGGISFAVIYANMLIANRIANRSGGFVSLGSVAYGEIAKLIPMLKFLLPGAALILAFLAGSWGSGLWEIYLRFKSAVPFGIADPLLEKDIGFYVFHLPFYQALYQGALTILILSLTGSGVVYLLRQSIGFDGRSLVAVKPARTHLLLLLGILAGSLFIYFQFKIYGMVQSGGNIVNGAGFADIKVTIPALRIMSIASLVSGMLLFITIGSRTWRPAIAAAAILIVGVIGSKMATGAIQKFIVGPNEMAKEAPYIKWSIANTRVAFNLDSIKETSFMPAENLSAEMLAANRATTDNIRLWDQAPLLTTYAQLQEIRTYYEFLDVDNDRYTIDGQLRQVMLSTRELVPSSLPSRIWINEHLSYTHGFGLCLGPVNSVTPEGLPDFFIKNIPPVSTGSLTVTRPEIYFGEAPTRYAIVKTGNKEFDYPSGEENVYSNYTGTGGIPMGGMLKRMLFALKFKELKILLTGYIRNDSRILYNRNIMARVSTALPFLLFDSDPYMVVAKDGRLFWMVDGYTTSNAYPYSASVKDIGNYIRNSAKVTVDAYNGTIAAYMADSNDPIIKTYDRIFPGIFRPLDAMPEDLRTHIRYPQTLFTVQAKVFSIYHMSDPQVYYIKEDIWKFPESYVEGQSGPMVPYYTIMKLAGIGQAEEFILMVPFSPSKKENMIAWLAARCDGPNYGKLVVFNFPKEKLVYGPSQIESRISQDPEISKQITLWNQGGSRVIFGSLLVIPIEQSIIYVQPLYIAAQSGGVPELKRVLVSYGNSIAMETTLEKSLNMIFGKSSGPATAETPLAMLQPSTVIAETRDIEKLIGDANSQFQRAQSELGRKNWAGYGSAMDEVEQTLQELAKLAKNKK